MVDDNTPRRRWRAHSGLSSPESAVFAATEELLNSRPLHEISVDTILEHSGISRAAFYYYFSSKHDVVAYLAASALNEIYHQLDAWTGANSALSSDMLRGSLERGVALWVQHGPIFAAVIENMHAVPELREVWITQLDRFTEVIACEIERQRRSGAAPAGAPAEAVAGALVWGSERLLYLGFRGLEDAIPTVETAGASLIEVWFTVIYGSDKTGAR
jgi:TetR/AcrR family transcriptional regulator, ethionamide resistance regulator